MTAEPRRRRVAILTALALALPLASCIPVPASPASGPGSGAAAMAVVHRAARGPGGAAVVEDEAARAIRVVPQRRNGALVVYLHGWGQARWAVLERPNEARVARALVAAGFTVLGADADLKAWGDPESVGDYRRLIADAQRRYRLTDVFLMGESMGGLATMQLAAALPAVRAVTAWYPVCDLRTMLRPRFRASIAAAWRGHDRAAVSPVQVSAKPMLVWASPQDTVVRAATNAAVCVARARRAGARVGYVRTTGQHGDPSNFVPSAVVRFFQRYRTRAV